METGEKTQPHTEKPKMTNMNDYMNPWSDFANWGKQDEGDESMDELFETDKSDELEDSDELDMSAEKISSQKSEKPSW